MSSALVPEKLLASRQALTFFYRRDGRPLGSGAGSLRGESERESSLISILQDAFFKANHSVTLPRAVLVQFPATKLPQTVSVEDRRSGLSSSPGEAAGGLVSALCVQRQKAAKRTQI
jgi:hypothetical protein